MEVSLHTPASRSSGGEMGCSGGCGACRGCGSDSARTPSASTSMLPSCAPSAAFRVQTHSSAAALRCCGGRVQPGSGTPPSNPSPSSAPRSPAVGLTVQSTHWEGMCQLFICARLCHRLETRRGVSPWGLPPTTILLWADRLVHHHAESLGERERVAGRLPGDDGL